MQERGAEPNSFDHGKQLDYARGAVVGAVVVDRRRSADGSASLVITIQRIAPVLRVGVAMMLAGAIATSGALAARFAPSRPSSAAETLWIVGALAGLAWMIAGAKAALDSARSRTIESSHGNVSLLFRQERNVARAEFAASSIADVLLVKPPLRIRLLHPGARLVHAVLWTGDRIELHLGRFDEAKFLRQILADEFVLPAEQWVDAGVPRFPAFSRMKHRVDPRGIQMTQPAGATWGLLLVTGVLSPAMPFIVAWMRTLSGRSWQNVWERDMAPIVSGVGTLLVGLAICAIAYHFKRSTTITLDPRMLVVDESSPIRPALLEWPTAQVRGFVLANSGAKRVTISAEFSDHSPAVAVLQGLRQRDAPIAIECLRVALQRAQQRLGERA
ncbi:hypothetical protein BH09PLA1_BH09PLA1_01700 [soil metagenome]